MLTVHDSARISALRVFRRSALVAVLALSAACADNDFADLVLRNGNIVTVDDANPRAQALAVRDGRIMAVGSDSQIDAYVGSGAQVIDLEGKTAIPGFIEGHTHFTGVGNALPPVGSRGRGQLG